MCQAKVLVILERRLITPPPGLLIQAVSSASGYNNAPRWESLSFLFTAVWWPWLASTLPYFHSIHPSLQKCWHCNNPAFQRPPRAACLLTSPATKQAHPWHFSPAPPREIHKSRVFMIGPPAACNESCERSAWKHCDLLTREKHTAQPIFS